VRRRNADVPRKMDCRNLSGTSPRLGL
jgi:hypothetical protein